MEALLKSINEHERTLAGIERLRGYITDIESVRIDKPDHVVELCSALIECVSKNLLNSHVSSESPQKIDKEKLQGSVKKTLNKMKGLDPLVDDAIIEHLCKAVQDLGTLRNKRGEVSHGRIHPKLESSSKRFQELVIRFTEAISIYLIEVTADCAAIELTPEDAEVDFYEADNELFNDFLDEEVPEDGGLHYGQRASYALYLLDYDLYVQRLEEWKDQNEEEAA